MTAASLRPLTEQVFDRYALSPEARAVAHESCFLIRHGMVSNVVSQHAAKCYASIAASLRPMLACDV